MEHSLLLRNANDMIDVAAEALSAAYEADPDDDSRTAGFKWRTEMTLAIAVARADLADILRGEMAHEPEDESLHDGPNENLFSLATERKRRQRQEMRYRASTNLVIDSTTKKTIARCGSGFGGFDDCVTAQLIADLLNRYDSKSKTGEPENGYEPVPIADETLDSESPDLDDAYGENAYEALALEALTNATHLEPSQQPERVAALVARAQVFATLALTKAQEGKD